MVNKINWKEMKKEFMEQFTCKNIGYPYDMAVHLPPLVLWRWIKRKIEYHQDLYMIKDEIIKMLIDYPEPIFRGDECNGLEAAHFQGYVAGVNTLKRAISQRLQNYKLKHK